MSINALISGRLFRAAQARTSSTGKRFVTATLRVPAKDGASIFVSAIAFSPTVCDALLALGDGDAVALSGELQPKVYLPKDGGEPRPALDLIAHLITTEYHVHRKRQAVQSAQGAAPHESDRAAVPPAVASVAQPEFDDEIPF